MRTLTIKSTMNFGKFADLKVSEILDVFKQSEYLRWCYYNMSHISFMPDILEKINVIEQIDKPGKAPELFVNDVKEIKVLSIKEACYYKALGEKTKNRLEIKCNKASKRTKEFLMNKNRTKI